MRCGAPDGAGEAAADDEETEDADRRRDDAGDRFVLFPAACVRAYLLSSLEGPESTSTAAEDLRLRALRWPAASAIS